MKRNYNMKKFVTLLLITLVSAIGMEINANTALATDTLVVKPVLMDSATNSEVDTLAMSVVAPELKECDCETKLFVHTTNFRTISNRFVGGCKRCKWRVYVGFKSGCSR